MPFIQITSLPLASSPDISIIVRKISSDFSSVTGIALNHIHTTWMFLPPGHYAKGDKTPSTQPQQGHPVIVDLLTPDFNDQATIETMLTCIATSISDTAEIPLNNIFINHRQAKSGQVFDDGEIVYWH